MEPLIASITNQICLGNIRAAMDDTLLQQFEVTGILNVSEMQYMTSQAEMFCCPLRDDERNRVSTLLAATDLLDELKARHKHRVLVHCHHGGSRSVAVLMLWLARNKIVPNLAEARALIQSKYPLKLSARQPRPGLYQLMEQALVQRP